MKSCVATGSISSRRRLHRVAVDAREQRAIAPLVSPAPGVNVPLIATPSPASAASAAVDLVGRDADASRERRRRHRAERLRGARARSRRSAVVACPRAPREFRGRVDRAAAALPSDGQRVELRQPLGGDPDAASAARDSRHARRAPRRSRASSTNAGQPSCRVRLRASSHEAHGRATRRAARRRSRPPATLPRARARSPRRRAGRDPRPIAVDRASAAP